MFEKKKEDLQEFKEMMKDKRFRSMVFLGVWIVIIIIVMIFTRLDYSSYSKNVDTLEAPKTILNTKEMSSYNYSLLETKDAKMSVITGKVYNDYLVFNINNEEYYYNGVNVYKMSNPVMLIENFNLSYLKITPKMINNMIDRATLLETDKYTLSLTDFLTLYDVNVMSQMNANDLNGKNVLINVYNSGDFFYKVEIDITQYTKIITPNIQKDVLTFNYTEINEVNDFIKEYESRVQK